MAVGLVQLRSSLVAAVEERLEKYGFRPRKWVTFRAGAKGHTMEIVAVCAVLHRGLDLDAFVHFNIRYEEVERVIDAWPDNPSGRRAPLSSTLAVEYGRLIGVGQRRWTVADKGDIPDAVSGIIEATTTEGFRFFSRFQSLEDLIGVLTSSTESLKYCLEPTRAMALPIAAALLGQKQEVEIQCQLQYRLVQNHPNFPWLAERYPSFVKFLGHRFGIRICLEGR